MKRLVFLAALLLAFACGKEKETDYIVQVSLGGWNSPDYAAEQVISRLDTVCQLIPVGKVIIGWSLDKDIYRQVGTYLHGKGIQMLLWLPVFAEVGMLSEPDEAADIFGNRIPSPVQDDGADFLFCCPSSGRNLQIVKDIWEKHFSGCGFDGVFLDRIRSQSFVSGVSGVLSCGCARCAEAFGKRGVDLRTVRNRYEMKKDSFFDMVSFPADGYFVTADETARRFFDVKAEIIAGAVTELCDYFKGKGLIVGLDLFAPLVSRFVGQDYALITQRADFIKPMLYRRTDAPAGIGYEYALYEKNAPGAAGRIGISMDKAFLDSQLDAISRVSCEKFPGIEINYRSDVVRTDHAYIAESLSAVRDHGFEGAVLCWNMMEAPPEHIDAVAAIGS